MFAVIKQEGDMNSGRAPQEPVAFASVALFQELSQLQDQALDAFTGYLYGQVCLCLSCSSRAQT